MLWKKTWKTSYDVNAATPIFIPPDRVFVASGYDTGGALLKVKRQADRTTVEEVWRSRGMKNQFSSSIYVDGYIYGFDNSTFKAIDARTGQEAWAARPGLGHGSLTYADGHLFVLGDRGKLVLVEATPEAYREKASVQLLKGKCWTVPTLSNGRLFVRNEKVATLAVLLIGVVAMLRGGDFNAKYGNKLMRARIAMQALAVGLMFSLYLINQAGGE